MLQPDPRHGQHLKVTQPLLQGQPTLRLDPCPRPVQLQRIGQKARRAQSLVPLLKPGLLRNRSIRKPLQLGPRPDQNHKQSLDLLLSKRTALHSLDLSRNHNNMPSRNRVLPRNPSKRNQNHSNRRTTHHNLDQSSTLNRRLVLHPNQNPRHNLMRVNLTAKNILSVKQLHS